MPNGVTVTSVTPAFGSLLGGSHITITGSGFTFEGAAPNHVVIGGHEAPLAAAIDDRTLEVVVPPSDTAGDADIVVFNHQGAGTVAGQFHYSTAPMIASVTPGDVLYTTPSTVMTASGTGFQDENAGFLQVQVDGLDAVDVQVLSDTQVKFTAFGAPLLTTPNVTITNARGVGELNRAFRYVPSTHHGLIIFQRPGTPNFVEFYDPTDQSITAVPRIVQSNFFPTSTLIVNGDIYALTRNNTFGKLDFRNQVLEDSPPPIQLPNTMNGAVMVSGTAYGIQRGGNFGKIDLTNGTVDPIVTLCCRGFGVAANASGTIYVTYEDNTGTNFIQSVTPTGTLGSAVALGSNLHTRDLRFLDGQLYGLMMNRAVSSDQTLIVKIDPTTGTTTTVKTFDDRRNAMEVFQ